MRARPRYSREVYIFECQIPRQLLRGFLIGWVSRVRCREAAIMFDCFSETPLCRSDALANIPRFYIWRQPRYMGQVGKA